MTTLGFSARQSRDVIKHPKNGRQSNNKKRMVSLVRSVFMGLVGMQNHVGQMNIAIILQGSMIDPCHSFRNFDGGFGFRYNRLPSRTQTWVSSEECDERDCDAKGFDTDHLVGIIGSLW